MFLTHDWNKDELGRDNHQRVGLVCAMLKQHGIVPWFDAERLAGQLLHEVGDWWCAMGEV